MIQQTLTPVVAPTIIAFTVPAVPVPQPRVRATVRGGHAAVYTPPTVGSKEAGTKRPHPILHFKSIVAHAANQAYHGAPLAGPIRAELLFIMPRPNNMRWKTKPMPRAPETRQRSGDIDNLEKSVFDALNGILFIDDAQVFRVVKEKWIASGLEQPRVEITIADFHE